MLGEMSAKALPSGPSQVLLEQSRPNFLNAEVRRLRMLDMKQRRSDPHLVSESDVSGSPAHVEMVFQ
jgi:hypothetical protein